MEYITGGLKGPPKPSVGDKIMGVVATQNSNDHIRTANLLPFSSITFFIGYKSTLKSTRIIMQLYFYILYCTVLYCTV